MCLCIFRYLILIISFAGCITVGLTSEFYSYESDTLEMGQGSCGYIERIVQRSDLSGFKRNIPKKLIEELKLWHKKCQSQNELNNSESKKLAKFSKSIDTYTIDSDELQYIF